MLKSENQSIKSELEAMRQSIQKLASVRVSVGSKDEIDVKNRAVIESLQDLSTHGYIERNLEELTQPNESSRRVPEYQFEQHNIQEIQPTQRRPFNKIVKKKMTRNQVKQMTLRRKQEILNEIKQKTPLSENELKLLHDPSSFEKYAK